MRNLNSVFRISFILVLLISCIVPSLSFGAQKLHLVTSLDPLEAGEYIKEFEKTSGIEVEWIRLSAGEVVARLKAEGNNQTQSVWFGGPMSEYVAAKEDGLLLPYLSPKARELEDKLNDKEGYFTNIYFGSIAFITNKNYLERKKVKPPLSWSDLLRKEWQGRIAVAYPYTAGTGYTILSGLIELMGEDGAFAFCRKLDPSIHHYTKSGAAPVIEIGLGEAAVGIVFSQDAVRKGIKRGFPIVISYPADGVPYEIGSVALIRNGPEAELGKKFIDWIISSDGQNLFHKYGRTPLHPKAKSPDDIKRIDEIRLIDMDPVKAGKMKKIYIDRWRRELRQ